MSSHPCDALEAATRLTSALTGADHASVQRTLEHLLTEATGAGLSVPTSEHVESWYADSLTVLDTSGLPASQKATLARSLLSTRVEDVDGIGFHAQSLLLARVRQQQVVDSVSGLVKLAAPGSQAHLYERGADGRPAKVFYASYGSNLYAERMNVYIEGGSPNGGKTVYAGARDKTPIMESVPVALPGTVHYAGDSTVWTGGVAFLDTSVGGRSLGRAHLLTAEQFDDVVFQESNAGLLPDGSKVDLSAAIVTGRTVGQGLYGTLQHVGDHNGVPVVTFTGPFSTADALRGDLVLTPDGSLAMAAGREAIQVEQEQAVVLEQAQAAAENRPPKQVPQDWPVYSNAPSPAYQAMIGGGLQQTYGLSPRQVDTYFRGATGYTHRPVEGDAAASA